MHVRHVLLSVSLDPGDLVTLYPGCVGSVVVLAVVGSSGGVVVGVLVSVVEISLSVPSVAGLSGLFVRLGRSSSPDVTGRSGGLEAVGEGNGLIEE